eukprot:1145050-Pelagomonas_calceolata.AAC.3
MTGVSTVSCVKPALRQIQQPRGTHNFVRILLARAFKPHITVCKTSKLKHGRGRSGGHGRGRGHAKTESNRGGLQQCMREGTELGTVSEIAPEQHKEDQVEEGLCSHGEDSHQQEHVQQWQPHKERISLDASNPGNMCVSHDSEPQDHDSVPRSKDNHAASKRDSGQGREEEVPNKRMRTAWSEDVGLVYTEAAASLPTPALVRDPLQHDSAAPTQLQAPASFHAPPPAAWTTEMNPSPGQPAAAVAAATATAPSLSTWGSDDRQGHVVGSQFQQQPHNLVHEGPDFEHPKPAPPQQGMAKEEIQALRRQRKERQHNEKQRKRQQQQQKKQQQEQQPVRQHRDQRDHGADVRIHEQNEQSVRELPVRGIPREAYQAFLDVDAGVLGVFSRDADLPSPLAVISRFAMDFSLQLLQACKIICFMYWSKKVDALCLSKALLLLNNPLTCCKLSRSCIPQHHCNHNTPTVYHAFFNPLSYRALQDGSPYYKIFSIGWSGQCACQPHWNLLPCQTLHITVPLSMQPLWTSALFSSSPP